MNCTHLAIFASLNEKKMLRQAVVDVTLTGGSHRLLRKRHDTQAKFKHRLGAWKTPQQQLTLKATNCLFWEEPNLESVNQFQMECNTKNTLLCKNQPVISLYFACNDPNFKFLFKCSWATVLWVSEGLSKWFFGWFSFIFSPVSPPDHFQFNVFCLLKH